MRRGRAVFGGALFIGAAALAGGGCRQRQSADSFPSAVQLVNGVSASDKLEAKVNGKMAFQEVAYGSSSSFYGVVPGHYPVDVSVYGPSGSPFPITGNVSVDPQRHYTAVAYGLLGGRHAPAISVCVEEKLSPKGQERLAQNNKVTLRVFNAALGCPRADFLVNNIVAFKNVGYGQESPSIALAALPYEWSVKQAGDSVTSYGDPVTISPKPGHSYLVVVMGNVPDRTLQIKAFED